MTTQNTAAKDAIDAFKASQRDGWAMFAPLELITTPPAATLVRYASVKAGDHVLDVACGTGVVAVTAAVAGAQVSALDFSPVLLERARYNAKMAGVTVDYVEGDAEKLPYNDGSFDVVLSQFGHMFAPRPDVTIKELLRVLKPGGRIAFSTWPGDVYTGKMFALVGKYLPPPPSGVSSPVQWGDPAIIRERLGDAVEDVTFDRDRLISTGLSARHIATRFEESAAPVIKVVQGLKNDPTKLAKFRADLIGLVDNYFRDNQLRQDFLMTRAIKK